MSNADWANKDFYKVLGVAKDADQAAIKKAYRKLARENHPDSKPGRQGRGGPLQAGRRGLRRRRRRRQAQGVRRDALDVRRRRRRRLARRLPGRLRRQAGGSAGGLRHLRPVRRPVQPRRRRRRWLRHRTRAPRARPRAPTSRPRRRIAVRRTPIDGTTISLRLSSDAPCPTCSGTGGKPGTRPHVCPTCEGAGMVVSSVGGGFSMNETCPECHGRQLVYDEACPTCHGSGRGLSSRTVSGPHPGRRQGRPADPAQGQGCRRRERRPGRRPARHRARASRTRSSAARATTSRSRCR